MRNKIKNQISWQRKYRLSFMLAVLCVLLSACAQKNRAAGSAIPAETGHEAEEETPAEAMDYTMQALKSLELEEFNRRTDNYVRTYTNWLGIPKETEYRVFSELQQPGLRKGKHYTQNLRFAQQVLENLSWTIIDVQENGAMAEVKLEISNTDMAEVMGNYTISLMESMLESEGPGIGQLVRQVRQIISINESKDSLLYYMKEAEGIYTETVKVQAYREDGIWKFHISDAFINAFLGNMDAELSEEAQERLDELEEKYEQKWEKWGEEFENKADKWLDEHFD